jgi:hypothetical protein
VAKFAAIDYLLILRADLLFRTTLPPVSPTEAIRRVVRGCLRGELTFCTCLIPALEPREYSTKDVQSILGASEHAVVVRLLSRLEKRRVTITKKIGPETHKTVMRMPSVFSMSSHMPGYYIAPPLALMAGLDNRRGKRRGGHSR